MSDKLYTSYGEDKLLDLENENITNALKDAVGGGESSPITYIHYTDGEQYGDPITCDKTYQEIIDLYNNHVPMVAIYQGRIYEFFGTNSNDAITFYDTVIRVNSSANGLDGNFWSISHGTDETIYVSQLYGSIDASIVID